MNSKSSFHFGVGWPSILMIFVVLCLTTFGVLSYVTANADCKISIKNSQTVQGYYRANRQVQEKLRQADGALLAAQTNTRQALKSGAAGSSEIQAVLKGNLPKSKKCEECYRLFSRRLLSQCSGIEVEAGQTEGGALCCSYAAAAGRDRKILVEFSVNPYASAERYKITEEKLVPTQSSSEEGRSSESTMQLWQGSSKAG